MAFPSTQLLMALALAVTGSARAAAPLTPDQLRSAKATTNRPDGDRFVGRRGELNGLIDAFVADSSLAGPVHLYLAARTALELGRVEDAGSLFYAAQLRRRFELERRGLGTGGSEAEQYLAFLDQTIGGLVNPAVMRNPSAFTAAIARIERWGVAPALRASLEEFERTPVTVPPERQSSLEAELKKSFLDQFGYRYAALLNDTEYFAAFKTVQDANLGKARASGKARKAYLAAQRRMAEIEAALFPPRPATPKRLYEVREGVVWCAGCPNPRLVPGADPATIEEVGGGYGRDARRVYFGTEVVEGADPVTFQSIDARAGRDVSAVYVGKRRCSACDRDTFHPVGRSWFLDRVAAYYDSLGRLERVGGVDATSFQVLNEYMAKDRTRVYFGGRVIGGADAPSFRLAPGRCDICGEDRDHCYNEGYPVPCDRKGSNASAHFAPPPGMSVLLIAGPHLSWTGGMPNLSFAEPDERPALECSRPGAEPARVELPVALEADRVYRFAAEDGVCDVGVERPVLLLTRADRPEILVKSESRRATREGGDVDASWVASGLWPAGRNTLDVVCREVTRTGEHRYPGQVAVDLIEGRIYRLDLKPGRPPESCQVEAVMVGEP